VYLCAFAACALGCSSCELVVTTSKAYSSSCNQDYNKVAVEPVIGAAGKVLLHNFAVL